MSQYTTKQTKALASLIAWNKVDKTIARMKIHEEKKLKKLTKEF